MKDQPTYTIILRWSQDRRAYVGQVQELLGIEGSGKTYEEALASVLQALRWLREKNGESSSSPFSQMLMREPDETEQEEPPRADKPSHSY